MMNSEEFRDFLQDGGYLLKDILLRRFSIQRMYYPRGKYYYNTKKFAKAGLIRPLQRKKYGNSFVLTKKGKALLSKTGLKKSRSDGLATVILFDIPEEKHRERNILRRYLIRNGFTLFQKSALIAPFEISVELKELIDELKLKLYLKIIAGKVQYLQ